MIVSCLASPRRSEAVVLRDGSPALIRPLECGDAALVLDCFAGMSPRSRWLRFLSSKGDLSADELRYFTDVDHRDHEALAAVDRATGRGVGVARYVRTADDPRAAEVAVAVVDAWQRRGLGTTLLSRLRGRALDEGIDTFVGVVSADNDAMRGLLRAMDVAVGRARREAGVVYYEAALAPDRAGPAWWPRYPTAG